MDNKEKWQLRWLVKEHCHYDMDVVIKKIELFGFKKQTIKNYWIAINGKKVE